MDAANKATTETPEIKLHFLDYWRVIRLRKSLILTVFLLCVISSAFLTYWLPKQYASTVEIEVQKDDPTIVIVGSPANQSWDPYYLATQFRIMTDWKILCTVITNMNLQHKLAVQAQETTDYSIDDAYKILYRRVSVNQTRGTSLIDITVKNPDYDTAAEIAGRIADTYKTYRLDLWNSTHSKGLKALGDQVTNKYVELTNMMSDLDNLRAKLNVPELDGGMMDTTIYSETIRALEIRRIEAMADYIDHSDILAKVKKLDANNLLPKTLGTLLRGLQDQELFLRIERLAQDQENLTQLTERGYGPESSEIKAAQKQLAEATINYKEKIDGILNGLEGLVDHEKFLLDTINSREDEAKAESTKKTQEYRPYFTKKREVEEATKTYEDLNRRLTAEQVNAEQPNQNIVVIQNPPRPDKHPVSPKPMIIIPCGVLLGLLVGIGLAFFIEYLDTSVKTIDDVERSLQAPVLGVIPQNVGNVMDEGAESPHAEAYRVLRTNLLFSRKDENWSTITVLSGGAGEGKTTTLFNLAVIFAQNGEKILVVDSDLRRPSVHRMLKANNTTGLTDVLLNKQVTLEQVIQKTKLPTLDYLPSGKLPSSSMSILGSARMKEVVQELKRRYDYVFFDSPPLLGVSDASVLASQMDMVLQVIQYRRYPQPMTLRAKQMIQKVGGNLMGLVLNNINMSQDENYYYYSGYYEYEYRTPKSDPTVIHLPDPPDPGANPPKVEIKKKY